MEKIKKVFNTIVNKVKLFCEESAKDSKLLDLIFFSFIFVMLVLSIVGISVTMSSNKYKSAMVSTKIEDGEIKEITDNGSFLTREEDKDDSLEQPNSKPEENPDTEQDNNMSGENNNNNNNNNDNNNSTNPSNPVENDNSDINGNANNGVQSNDKNEATNSGDGNGSVVELPITPPTEIITISCTSSTRRNIQDNNIIYPTSIVEQVTAKFDAETKLFYQADVSIAMYYLKQSVDDLEALQDLYEKRLGVYANYFEVGNFNVIFSAPTEAYINMKNLDYKTYYKGYGKETETYDSFLYTFETGNYYCQT